MQIPKKSIYVEGGKTIIDLYNDYVEICQQKGEPFGTISLYRYLFNYEFNISFHTPKKDQFLLCTTVQNSSSDEKIDLADAYSSHIKEKELSRIEKKMTKKKLVTNFKLLVLTCKQLSPILKEMYLLFTTSLVSTATILPFADFRRKVWGKLTANFGMKAREREELQKLVHAC